MEWQLQFSLARTYMTRDSADLYFYSYDAYGIDEDIFSDSESDLDTKTLPCN